MDDAVARSRVRPISIVRHPIYSMLLPVPVICFLGVLFTDLAYLNSGGNFVWLDFSSWLLLFGLLSGAVAAVVLLIELARNPAARSAAGWGHALVFVAALLVGLLSMFIHQRDGWTAVAGLGVTLSVISAILMLVAGWLRRPALEVAP